MKYQRTQRFDRDYHALAPHHRAEFRAAVPEFARCADAAARGDASPWRPGLRVRAMAGRPGIYEMTWSMRDPDGRATWQWSAVDGEPAILWRRIGTHDIYGAP